MQVGYLGVGNMGQPMAEKLLDGGHGLVVFDISEAAMDPLLRRQARRKWRKPLIVFTPKSMLRHPDASSDIEALTQPRFLPLVPDGEIQGAKRILIQRKSRPRTARRKATAERHEHGDFLSRSTLSAAANGNYRRSGGASERARDHLGAGRAEQHGGAFLRVAEAAAAGARQGLEGAFGEALGERESGDGLVQGARAGAEDAAQPGVYHDSGRECRQLVLCRKNTLEKSGPSGAVEAVRNEAPIGRLAFPGRTAPWE